MGEPRERGKADPHPSLGSPSRPAPPPAPRSPAPPLSRGQVRPRSPGLEQSGSRPSGGPGASVISAASSWSPSARASTGTTVKLVGMLLRPHRAPDALRSARSRRRAAGLGRRGGVRAARPEPALRPRPRPAPGQPRDFTCGPRGPWKSLSPAGQGGAGRLRGCPTPSLCQGAARAPRPPSVAVP